MIDEQIKKLAREICAEQAGKKGKDDWRAYLSGEWDHTVWMRLVEQGIRRGLEGQTMIKTQHCPNCEATEQKLHDFRQEVSDMITDILSKDGAVFTNYIGHFIIPKPDPLVDVLTECDDGPWDTIPEYADKVRAALEARGLEIRSKNT